MILASRWQSMDQLLAAHPAPRVDLGCGWVKPEGYIGLDDLRGVQGLAGQSPSTHGGPDIYLDLNAERYPFTDASVAEVRSRHFLEHSLLDHVFSESHRILAPGGSFVAVVPYANSADGMAPGHSVFLTERFFELNPHFQERFAISRITYRQSEQWARWPRAVRRLVSFDWARTHLFNVCSEMRVEARRRA